MCILLMMLVCALGHIQQAIRTGAVLSRGVNLGGWLVLERWMTKNAAIWKKVPESIKDNGEYAAMSAVGRDDADPLIKEHRDTWITEEDIQEIASWGMNTVRVPVGWWIYENPTDTAWKHFTPGGIAYLDRLINDWAVKYNIAVLIDIHAAKGSQNGREHSAAPVFGETHFTDNLDNMQTTAETAMFLARRYANSPAFLGLELLNEPETGSDRTKLKLYYQNLHAELREICGNCVLVISPYLTEQDSNHPEWGTFLNVNSSVNNWIDWHKYLKWGFEGQTLDQITSSGVDRIENDLKAWRGNNRVFMGEWSLGHPDSARAQFQDDKKVALLAQRLVAALRYAKAGWTFWSWKADYGTRLGNGWSMQALLRSGLLKI
nr:secreted protein [Thraustotheca clavata]